MVPRLEADLRGPVSAWLQDAGFSIRSEVSLVGRRADLVGVRRDGVAAVELKLADWLAALRQAIAYQLAADWAWVAMPLAAAGRAHRDRWRFEREGIGLLAVDDAGLVRPAIPAHASPRLLPFARDAVRGGMPISGASGARPLSSWETGLQPF